MTTATVTRGRSWAEACRYGVGEGPGGVPGGTPAPAPRPFVPSTAVVPRSADWGPLKPRPGATTPPVPPAHARNVAAAHRQANLEGAIRKPGEEEAHAGRILGDIQSQWQDRPAPPMTPEEFHAGPGLAQGVTPDQMYHPGVVRQFIDDSERDAAVSRRQEYHDDAGAHEHAANWRKPGTTT